MNKLNQKYTINKYIKTITLAKKSKLKTKWKISLLMSQLHSEMLLQLANVNYSTDSSHYPKMTILHGRAKKTKHLRGVNSIQITSLEQFSRSKSSSFRCWDKFRPPSITINWPSAWQETRVCNGISGTSTCNWLISCWLGYYKSTYCHISQSDTEMECPLGCLSSFGREGTLKSNQPC